MRKTIAFFLLLLPFLVDAQVTQKLDPNGYNKFYYDNGVVSSEGVLRDGKPDGYWKTYSTKGVIKSEGNRKSFQLDSIWKFYKEFGVLAFEFNYINGKKNGSKNVYDIQTGQLLSSENYLNNVKEGDSFHYYKNEGSSLLANDGTLHQLSLSNTVQLTDEQTLFSLIRWENGDAYNTDNYVSLDLSWGWEVTPRLQLSVTGNNLLDS